MIEKPTIIVTSLGRTGTKFFAALFSEVLPTATSLHEPDTFTLFEYKGTGERIRQVIRQMRESGFHNLLSIEALRSGSLIEISDARVRSELGYAEAIRKLVKQRSRFIDSEEGSAYVESSIAYYGLIDVLKHACKDHRVAYVVRDARDWVRSNMDWGEIYGKGKIRQLIAHTWPTAPEIRGDPYATQWDDMSRFERLCWAWGRLNAYALETVKENPSARVYRFEDIFYSSERYQHLEDMTRFLMGLPGVEPVASDSLRGWLDRRIHKGNAQFPSWEEWTTKQKQSLTTLCGPLIEKLGYHPDSPLPHRGG